MLKEVDYVYQEVCTGGVRRHLYVTLCIQPSFTAAPHSGTNSCLFRLSKVADLTASVKLILRLLQDQSRKCLSTALLWYCKTPDSGHHVHLFTPKRSAFFPTPTFPSGVNIGFEPCIFNMCSLVILYFQVLLLHIYILHIYSIYLSRDIWMEDVLCLKTKFR